MFDGPAAADFAAAVERAVGLYREPTVWRKLQVRAMSQDFRWRCSAQRYRDLYAQLLSKEEQLSAHPM